MGRKRKRLGELLLYAFFFWIIWKERNGRSFENEELSNHGLKVLFLCRLFPWSNLFIGNKLMSLFDFIDWFGSVRFE